VPHNKVDVTRTDHYETELQRSSEEFGAHCRDGITPARPCRPKDKCVLEVGVKCVKGNFLPAGACRDLTGLNPQVRPIWKAVFGGVSKSTPQ